jgi:hypothetical protein
VAISKANFNSFNVTPTASKFITFNSSNNGLAADDIGGALKLISTQTASNSSSLSFTSGIDSTYKEYIFKFINMHPVTDSVRFTVNFRDGSSAFDATKTTTFFRSKHNEAGSATAFNYEANEDLAQSTSYQFVGNPVGNANDESTSGMLHLFDPSSTTFVKHFISRCNLDSGGAETEQDFVAGYCNVTAAIDGVDFKFSSGNIDSGVIKMYGVT